MFSLVFFDTQNIIYIYIKPQNIITNDIRISYLCLKVECKNLFLFTTM